MIVSCLSIKAKNIKSECKLCIEMQCMISEKKSQGELKMISPEWNLGSRVDQPLKE
jgi:hypothetical protein